MKDWGSTYIFEGFKDFRNGRNSDTFDVPEFLREDGSGYLASLHPPAMRLFQDINSGCTFCRPMWKHYENGCNREAVKETLEEWNEFSHRYYVLADWSADYSPDDAYDELKQKLAGVTDDHGEIAIDGHYLDVILEDDDGTARLEAIANYIAGEPVEYSPTEETHSVSSDASTPNRFDRDELEQEFNIFLNGFARNTSAYTYGMDFIARPEEVPEEARPCMHIYYDEDDGSAIRPTWAPHPASDEVFEEGFHDRFIDVNDGYSPDSFDEGWRSLSEFLSDFETLEDIFLSPSVIDIFLLAEDSEQEQRFINFLMQ